MPHHPQRPLDLGQQPVDPRAVDVLDRSEHADINALVLGHPDEGAQILGQAGAAEAQAGSEEIAADPGIQTDAPGHGRHVDAELLAQVGHQVDEGDLGGEEGVGRLLDQLGRRDARHDDRAVEAPLIEVEQQRARPAGIGADDDPGRREEVANRRPLAEELRIAGDVELALPAGQAADRPVDPVGGAGGNGALLHDQLVAIQQRGDRAGNFLDLAEVGPSIRPGRRPHAEEDDVGGGRRLLGSRREPEPAGLQVGGQQLLQTRLVEGGPSVRETRHDVRILVDRGHRVAELSEPHRRDQSRVARAEDSEPHVQGGTSDARVSD